MEIQLITGCERSAIDGKAYPVYIIVIEGKGNIPDKIKSFINEIREAI